jgi:hypothetical protein
MVKMILICLARDSICIYIHHTDKVHSYLDFSALNSRPPKDFPDVLLLKRNQRKKN